MKRWLFRGAVAALVLAVGGFLVAASGIIPIKASSGHWAITRWFLQFSQARSVATHSLGTKVPSLANPNLVLKGAGHYEIGCRSCHGAPGSTQPRVARAMLPAPPLLAPLVQNLNAKELFQVVKHGLKFTGMPAWPAQQRDDEVWAVVAFLLTLPDLDEAAYNRLINGEPAPPAAESPLSPATPAPAPAGAARLEVVNDTCIRCHGSNGLGRGSTVFPKLAGQRREYLENALVAYKSGARHSGIMETVAAALDDDTIDKLAAYYSKLDRTLEPLTAADAGEEDVALLERGRSIALEGLQKRRIPACIECHGPTGRRTKPAYPSLAGQPAEYLVLQLELFKNHQRGGSPYAHLMDEVAPRLDAAEMEAVAYYFESLPPDPSPP